MRGEAEALRWCLPKDDPAMVAELALRGVREWARAEDAQTALAFSHLTLTPSFTSSPPPPMSRPRPPPNTPSHLVAVTRSHTSSQPCTPCHCSKLVPLLAPTLSLCPHRWSDSSLRSSTCSRSARKSTRQRLRPNCQHRNGSRDGARRGIAEGQRGLGVGGRLVGAW
jgi:hypothetical protein